MAAKFNEDGDWYRARVTNTADELIAAIGSSNVNTVNNYQPSSQSFESRFAAAVATFGMRLRNHQVLKPWHEGQLIPQLESIARIAHRGIEGDEFGRKKEFVEMVKAAAKLSGGSITIDGDDEVDPPGEKGVGKSVKEKLNRLR